MNQNIQKILKKIESAGFEAYIVGGFVRDYSLDKYSTDVDICTNALPKDIIKIFNIRKDHDNYGSISINDGLYNFDITTYRKESNYVNRKPQTIEYTSNLISDLERRDFTINTLCMNSEGIIFDYYNAFDDLNKKIIKVVGNVETKFFEDPLRILRAIRFSTVLDFSLDDDIDRFLDSNHELVKTLSFNRKKEELDKILVSSNVQKGLNLLKKYNLLNELDIKYDNIVNVPDVLGMWAQLEFSSDYPFTKENKNSIDKIRTIIKNGKITNLDLFNYGLYICNVAGDILGISKEDLNKQYTELAIHSKDELCISSLDIMSILDIEPSVILKEIMNDILNLVINNSLQNNREEIEKYIIDKWK